MYHPYASFGSSRIASLASAIGVSVTSFGPVFGIGLPRHFILEFNDGNFATYIDPFHGGRTLTAQECFALAGATIIRASVLECARPLALFHRLKM